MKVDLKKIFPSTNPNSKLSKFWRHQNGQIWRDNFCVSMFISGVWCVVVCGGVWWCVCDGMDLVWLTSMLMQRGTKSEGRQAGSQSRGSGGSAGCHGRPGELLLSPIEDVSPSLEAAEQESMSRIQVGRHSTRTVGLDNADVFQGPRSQTMEFFVISLQFLFFLLRPFP